MKIAFLAAGAAGMYCGSCLRDNATARSIKKLGHEIYLIPLYTPLKLDRDEIPVEEVFYGGVNVYLQQDMKFFRKTPRFIDKLFDSKPVMALSAKLAGMTHASELGELTVSMLKGEDGNQKKELDRLCNWLAGDLKPDLINLPNSMFAGAAAEIKKRTGVPIICSLTGEDLFLGQLEEPHKSESLALLRSAVKEIDGFIAISRYYANYMAEYLEIPREKIHVVPLGINTDGFGRQTSRPTDPFTVGYLARIAPEKGFRRLCEAFRLLKQMPGTENARLLAAGWLGAQDRPYFEEIERDLKEWGLSKSFEYLGEVSFNDKIQFLNRLSVLSVPTIYHDPKGLFVLEALAHGVPVVQPNHGAFPELIQATGGGLLFHSADINDLAEKLHQIHRDRELADRLAFHGQMTVQKKFNDLELGRATLEVYEKYVHERNGRVRDEMENAPAAPGQN